MTWDKEGEDPTKKDSNVLTATMLTPCAAVGLQQQRETTVDHSSPMRRKLLSPRYCQLGMAEAVIFTLPPCEARQPLAQMVKF